LRRSSIIFDHLVKILLFGRRRTSPLLELTKHSFDLFAFICGSKPFN